MKRILLGIDGSPASRAAVRWVAAHAAPLGAEVVAATVIETGAEHRAPDHGEYERSRSALRDECLPIDASGVALETRVLCGDRTDAVLELAEHCDAAMIVLGRRSAPEPDGEHTGALVAAIARRSPRPVAVIPAATRTRLTSHIVVGVDGSPTGARALAVAASLAQPLAAHVLAVHAFRPPFGPVSGESGDWHQRGQERLDTLWTEPLREAGLASYSTLLVADNRAADVLLAVVTQHDSDLLVAGTRSFDGSGSSFLGSVALELLQHLERPLLLVPHAS